MSENKKENIDPKDKLRDNENSAKGPIIINFQEYLLKEKYKNLRKLIKDSKSF